MKRVMLAFLIVLIFIGVFPKKAHAQGCAYMNRGAPCVALGADGNPIRTYGGYPLPSSPYGYEMYRRSFPQYGYLDWYPQGGYYGRYDQYRRFEPILDSCGRELKAESSRWKQGIGTTVGMAVIGGLLGGKKGAAIGAAGGAALAVLNDSRYYSSPSEACGVIDSQQGDPRQQYQQQVGQVPPQAVQGPQPVAGPGANPGSGEFELTNQTRVYVEAYDGQSYIGRMAPGSTLRVGPPKDKYQGFALVPQPDGKLGKDELGLAVAPTGWSFVEPTFKGEK